jgi:hypothetical protein
VTFWKAMVGLLLLAACSSPTTPPARTGSPVTTATTAVVTSTTTVPPTTTTVTTVPSTTTHTHPPRTVHVASAGRTRPSDATMHRLAMCETGGKMDNPNTGNGYYGFFQFSLSTWRDIGGPGYPHEHSYETQKEYAIKLYFRDGWSPWPTCAKGWPHG